MRLSDLISWLIEHLRPVVVVTGGEPSRADWLTAVATVLGGAAAVAAVLVARRALAAAEETAQHSGHAVERADATLKGSVRPVLHLDKEPDSAGTIRVTNVGAGVALDVGWHVALSGDPVGVAVSRGVVAHLRPGISHPIQLRLLDSTSALSGSKAVLRCRDIFQQAHWFVIHLPTDQGAADEPITGLFSGATLPVEVEELTRTIDRAVEHARAAPNGS